VPPAFNFFERASRSSRMNAPGSLQAAAATTSISENPPSSFNRVEVHAHNIVTSTPMAHSRTDPTDLGLGCIEVARG